MFFLMLIIVQFKRKVYSSCFSRQADGPLPDYYPFAVPLDGVISCSLILTKILFFRIKFFQGRHRKQRFQHGLG